MKIIREKIITSDFGEKESEIFVYLSEKPTNKTLFILKGMYGRHRIFSEEMILKSWDMQFIDRFVQDMNVICCNTSSKCIEEGADRNARKQAFDGKTFQQEVDDVEKVIQRAGELIADSGLGKAELYFFGKSFGGTVLLGLPIFLQAKTVYMVGSGCGKSDTTTKTLLRTMPNEEMLLKNITRYKGNLYFFRGELDDVVPIESQEKIVNAMDRDRCEYAVVKGVDHEFEKVNGEYSDFPVKYLMQKIADTIPQAV